MENKPQEKQIKSNNSHWDAIHLYAKGEKVIYKDELWELKKDYSEYGVPPSISSGWKRPQDYKSLWLGDNYSPKFWWRNVAELEEKLKNK